MIRIFKFDLLLFKRSYQIKPPNVKIDYCYIIYVVKYVYYFSNEYDY